MRPLRRQMRVGGLPELQVEEVKKPAHGGGVGRFGLLTDATFQCCGMEISLSASFEHGSGRGDSLNGEQSKVLADVTQTIVTLHGFLEIL